MASSSRNAAEQSTWFWEYKSDRWALFPEEDQERLKEKCKKQKSATFLLDVTKSGKLDKVQLNFDSMTMKSARQRWNVCCGIEDAGKFYTWIWEGPTGKNYFSFSNVAELQRAATAGEKMACCTIKGVGKTIGLNQSVVEIGGSVCKVCRELVPLRKRAAQKQQSNGANEEQADGKCSPPKLPKWAVAAASLPRAVVLLQHLDQSVFLPMADPNAKSSDPPKNGHMSSVPLPPVDPECWRLKERAVVYSEDCDIYDAVLNQTNLEFNNNKFMVLQVLKEDNKEAYYAWFHWGRVGKRGQSRLVPCEEDKEKAKALFLDKFKQKTLNNWSDRAEFEKHAGKYDMVKVDYSSKKEEEHQKEYEELCRGLSDTSEEEKPCQLTAALQALMSFISSVSNIKVLRTTVAEMHYDLIKAPLGELTFEQIQLGYKALSKIEECIKANKRGNVLVSACNEFYTHIPHDFGMKRSPTIATLEEVCKKVKLLEALSDIKVTLELGKKEQLLKACHPLDRLYLSMECSLSQVQDDDDEYQFQASPDLFTANKHDNNKKSHP